MTGEMGRLSLRVSTLVAGEALALADTLLSELSLPCKMYARARFPSVSSLLFSSLGCCHSSRESDKLGLCRYHCRCLSGSSVDVCIWKLVIHLIETCLPYNTGGLPRQFELFGTLCMLAIH